MPSPFWQVLSEGEIYYWISFQCIEPSNAMQVIYAIAHFATHNIQENPHETAQND